MELSLSQSCLDVGEASLCAVPAWLPKGFLFKDSCTGTELWADSTV